MINISKIFSCLSLASTVFFSAQASAQAPAEDTGFRKIVQIGCHNTDGTCFVALDGTSFGTTLGCPSGPTTSFRFDNGDTAIGKRTFGALMAAYLSGKRVAVHLNGCSAQGVPLIQYFNIAD